MFALCRGFVQECSRERQLHGVLDRIVGVGWWKFGTSVLSGAQYGEHGV
jgi:hypothetical protein